MAKHSYKLNRCIHTFDSACTYLQREKVYQFLLKRYFLMSWKCLRVSPHPWFHKPTNRSEHRDVLTYCQNIGQYQWVTRTTAYNNELFSVITELQNISLFLNGPWFTGGYIRWKLGFSTTLILLLIKIDRIITALESNV